MQPIVCSLGALAIANIYYWYRYYLQTQEKRQQTLRERVTYMLWVLANRAA
jgi:hypothetical protein